MWYVDTLSAAENSVHSASHPCVHPSTHLSTYHPCSHQNLSGHSPSMCWRYREKYDCLICMTKVHIVKAMVFPGVMYGCESRTIRKAECQRIDAFELWCWRTPESPLNSKEIKPVTCKGNQPWVFIGRTDAEAEAPILWPPDVKSWLTEKDAGKAWRQEEKALTESEMGG